MWVICRSQGEAAAAEEMSGNNEKYHLAGGQGGFLGLKKIGWVIEKMSNFSVTKVTVNIPDGPGLLAGGGGGWLKRLLH